MTDLRLEATAYHEAGHAVVAWLCDHALGECTIKPDDDAGWLGSIRHDDYGLSDLYGPGGLHPYPDAPGGWLVLTGDSTGRHLTEDELRWVELNEGLGVQSGDADEAHVMIAAAGQEAQRRFARGTVEPHQSSQDWESVAEHLGRLAGERGSTAEEVRDQMTTRTAELLRDPLVWRVVDGVARGLLEHETLFARDVNRVIREVIAPSEDS